MLPPDPQRWTLLAIHPKFLRLDMTKDLSISKSAEKFSYWSSKKANTFKAKRLIEHVYALSTCLTLTNTLVQIDKHTHTHTHTHTYARALTHLLTHTHTKHTHTHTYTQAPRDMCKKREYVLLRNFWSCMER